MSVPFRPIFFHKADGNIFVSSLSLKWIMALAWVPKVDKDTPIRHEVRIGIASANS